MAEQPKEGWIVSGVVVAPPKKVWQVMLEVNPAIPASARGNILNARDRQPFVLTEGKAGEGRLHIEVDPQLFRISLEGEWWYRGVYRVESHKGGSLLTYRVYNIAPGIGRWAAQLVQGPQHARHMKHDFQQLLQLIAERLNCETSLLAG